MQCVNCHALLTPGAGFCGVCHQPVPVVEGAPQPAEIVAPQQGTAPPVTRVVRRVADPVAITMEDRAARRRKTLVFQILVTVALVAGGVLLLADVLGLGVLRLFGWIIYGPVALFIGLSVWRRGPM